VDKVDLMSKIFSNSLNEFEMNCGPLSEMILLGNPNLL